MFFRLCPSVTSRRSSIETAEWSELVFGWPGNFLWPILLCVGGKFGYLQKYGYLLCIFALNSGLMQYRQGKSMLSSTELIDTWACGSDPPWWTRSEWTHVVYSNYISVVNLLYNLFLRVCSSWQNFDWHSISCSPSAVAELNGRFKLEGLGDNWPRGPPLLCWFRLPQAYFRNPWASPGGGGSNVRTAWTLSTVQGLKE